MSQLLELTGFEYSFDMKKWKPILKGIKFGNCKQSVFIRSRDNKNIKATVYGKVDDCKMIEVTQRVKP